MCIYTYIYIRTHIYIHAYVCVCVCMCVCMCVYVCVMAPDQRDTLSRLLGVMARFHDVCVCVCVCVYDAQVHPLLFYILLEYM